MADDDDPLRQRLDVVHVVGGEQDGDAALAVQALDHLAHGELRRRVQADGGLIEEEDRRLVQQGRGDLGAHALAERELAHRLVEEPLQAQEGDEFVAVAAVALRRQAVDVAQQVEAVGDWQVPPELGPLTEDDADLRHVGDAVVEGRAAVHDHASAVGFQDARENLDGGGLARPVGADEAQELAGLQGKGDVAQGLDRAVAAMDQTLDRAQQAGIALGDAIGLGQVLDEDLRHGRAPVMKLRRARTLGRARQTRNGRAGPLRKKSAADASRPRLSRS